MKKYISALSIIALLAGVNVAAARNNDGNFKFKAHGDVRAENRLKIGLPKITWGHDNRDQDRFVIIGTVTTKTDSTLTLAIEADNREDISDSITVAVTSDTIVRGHTDVDTLAEVVVGNKVMVKGFGEDPDYKASVIHVMIQRQPKMMGEVTAVTDTSVTIKNNLTGEEKVVIVEPETKVVVNGEAQASTDIQVGDKGWVKFKAGIDAAIAKVISLFR